jgi:hypothetical protein
MKEFIGDCLGIWYSARRLSRGFVHRGGLLMVGVEIFMSTVGEPGLLMSSSG